MSGERCVDLGPIYFLGEAHHSLLLPCFSNDEKKAALGSH